MKSFCIKNNNNLILDYLLAEFQNMDLKDTHISQNKFKFYKNIIVHYTGNNEVVFINKISNILMNCIIKFYEGNILKRIINSDFFYFNSKEKSIIYENCIELINSDGVNDYSNTNDCSNRKEIIYSCLCDYISENKYFILDGFINFRLFEYYSLIEEVVDIAVNKYIIDKEYREFIELLHGYIISQDCRTGMVHLIYSKNEPILLDENQNVLVYDNKFENPKYLSDISFSSNDYCLNMLLNLLPQKLIIHALVDEDEFIETLKLIFGNRLMICKECNICKTFSLLNVQ